MAEGTIENSVRAFRDRSGLSQQALAERAGVTRQAIIAIEAGRQIPNTALALQLARALDTRIDELFTLGDPEALDVLVAPPGPDAQAAERVALGTIDGTLVAHPLPADQAMTADGVLLEAVPSATPAIGRVRPFVRSDGFEDRALVAGCAPLLSLLSHRLHMRWLPATSHRALDLLDAGTIHVAGIHLSGEDAAQANRTVVERRFRGRDMLIVNLTMWRQGLVVPAGNPLGIHDVTDLLRPGLRFVGRDAGAGATQLLSRLLGSEGSDGAPRPVAVTSGHDEVARYVRYGGADAGIAIEGVALARGLGFVPLTEERFDLVVPAELARTAVVARLLDFVDDEGFRDEVGRFPGYDASLSGRAVEVRA